MKATTGQTWPNHAPFLAGLNPLAVRQPRNRQQGDDPFLGTSVSGRHWKTGDMDTCIGGTKHATCHAVRESRRQLFSFRSPNSPTVMPCSHQSRFSGADAANCSLGFACSSVKRWSIGRFYRQSLAFELGAAVQITRAARQKFADAALQSACALAKCTSTTSTPLQKPLQLKVTELPDSKVSAVLAS